MLGPVIQLRWDQRSIEALEFGRVSLLVPASFASVVVWWRFKRVLSQWQDTSGELDLVVFDPEWLRAISDRRAPTEIMLLVDPQVLEDEGYRLRLALHELAITLDDQTQDVD